MGNWTAGLLGLALLGGACTQAPRTAGPADLAVAEAAMPVAASDVSMAVSQDVELALPGLGQRMPSGRALGSRSAAVAPNAAAATAHPLATQTALDIMKAGGNALDAAIAANAMLGLVEPTGNGIGGDLFAIIWDPGTEQLYGYNGSGRSPMSATLADMQAAADAHMDGEEIPPFGAAPVSVPGTVEAWGALHERFGEMTFGALLQPTIRYARQGAPIPEVIAFYWGRNETRLREAAASGMLEEFANAEATFFSPSPVEGALFRNRDLADTLEKIAEQGPDVFYKGEIAQTMDAYFERIGGFLSYDDLAQHEGEWVEPFCADYREARVCQLGPNTQGVAALQMLQMLESFPMREFGFGTPDSLMAQVEAKRLAFADRARGYADPAFSGIDPEVFVNHSYNSARAENIDLNAAMPANQVLERIPISLSDLTDEQRSELLASGNSPQWIQEWAETGLLDDMYYAYVGGSISLHFNNDTADNSDRDIFILADPEMLEAADKKLNDGDTTYITTADANGMMVSLIQSNYRGMGTGLVPDGLGFMLQDRGQLFSLDPAHPNVFEPGKRPFHTIIPGFAFKQVDGEHLPWLSFGLMGGGMQPQGHVQVILNLIDYDMGLQEAGDAARWEHRGGCEPTDALEGDECETDMGVVRVEAGIPPETRAELEARGHTVQCCDANGGGYQAIMRDFESGAWIAATEMRKDGNADGF